MKVKVPLLLAVCFLIFLTFSAAGKDFRPALARQSRGGTLYRAGVFSVLELSGSYREMGRQYGELLREDLQNLYREAVIEFFHGEKGMSMEELKKTAFAVFGPYPRRYREILAGMAETSGLDLEQHILLNAVEWYPKIAHLSAGEARCSGIAAWGPYSVGGRLVFGRNNDDDPLYRKFSKYLTTAVFKLGDGSFCGVPRKIDSQNTRISSRFVTILRIPSVSYPAFPKRQYSSGVRYPFEAWSRQRL